MNQEKRAREIEQVFITITRASAALEVALKRDFGLSLGEYRVLDEVASTGEIGIRMGELAQSVIFSPSRLTHTYRRLASRNLVVRTPYDFDRRGGTITLTDAGKELIAKAQRVERALLRDIISDDISDEDLSVIIRVSSDVNTRLDEVEKRH